MNTLETISAILGIGGAVAAIYKNIWAWPLYFFSSVGYFFVFKDLLFSDALLQLFFAAMQIWGFIHWFKSKSAETQEITVGFLSKKEILMSLVISSFAFVLWYSILPLLKPKQAFYFWDVFNTVLSVSATIFQIKKKIENWLLWILVNVIYIPLYIQQKLYLTAALYFFLLVISLLGYKSWKSVKK